MNQDKSNRLPNNDSKEAIAELENKYRQGQDCDVAELLNWHELTQEPSAGESPRLHYGARARRNARTILVLNERVQTR